MYISYSFETMLEMKISGSDKFLVDFHTVWGEEKIIPNMFYTLKEAKEEELKTLKKDKNRIDENKEEIKQAYKNLLSENLEISEEVKEAIKQVKKIIDIEFELNRLRKQAETQFHLGKKIDDLYFEYETELKKLLKYELFEGSSLKDLKDIDFESALDELKKMSDNEDNLDIKEINLFLNNESDYITDNIKSLDIDLFETMKKVRDNSIELNEIIEDKILEYKKFINEAEIKREEKIVEVKRRLQKMYDLRIVKKAEYIERYSSDVKADNNGIIRDFESGLEIKVIEKPLKNNSSNWNYENGTYDNNENWIVKANKNYADIDELFYSMTKTTYADYKIDLIRSETNKIKASIRESRYIKKQVLKSKEGKAKKEAYDKIYREIERKQKIQKIKTNIEKLEAENKAIQAQKEKNRAEVKERYLRPVKIVKEAVNKALKKIKNLFS